MFVPVPLPTRSVARASAFAVLALIAVMLFPSAASAESTFSITGRGWGHGIGLSQYGAKGMAESGSSYSAILKHYYQQTSLGQTSNIVVKVNLDRTKNSRGSWWFRSGDSSSDLIVRSVADSADSITLTGDKSYWVTVYEGGIRLRASSNGAPGTLLKKFSGGVYVVATAPDNGDPSLVTLLGTSGPLDRSGVRWRGTMHFDPAGSSTAYAVNRVRMEDYLKGVVPRESPASWHIEALKAQAIAARSYAYTSAADGAVLYCTVYSQVYHGHSQTISSGIVMHEDSRTNTAVAATEGLVVKYGGEVVRTYFFSCSGGHTANIEDVWGGSPRVFYRGVPDLKENGPYTKSWGDPIAMTGTTLGGKIRGRYPSAAPASGAVVNLSVTRATSGHVTDVRLYWSNGSSTVVTGDQFRSALGLRSTVYYVKVNGPFLTPVGAVRFQQNDARIEYRGTWTSALDSQLSGGSWTYSAAKGSRVLVRFKGSGVYLVGKKRPSYGRAAVYLDGKYVTTISLYASRTQYQQLLFSKSGLAEGNHTLDVRVLGTKDSQSSGYYVGLDALDVRGDLLAPPSAIRYEQDRLGLAYTGEWLDYASGDLSSGGYRYTKTAGSKATVRFRGTAIYWTTTKKSAYGIAEVVLDGVSQGTVNLYSAVQQNQKVVWSASGLADAEHVLEIRCTGDKDPDSTWIHVGVDALDVVGKGVLLPVGAVRYEQPDPRIAYQGTWTKVSDNPLLSNGSYRYATAAGASAQLAFEGTEVHWITTKRPSYGKAEVFLDGVSQGVVDLFGSETRYQQDVWSVSGLSPGTHTLKIVVLHQKNAASSSYLVGVDAFDVVGQ